jgi:hypothetical protein
MKDSRKNKDKNKHNTEIQRLSNTWLTNNKTNLFKSLYFTFRYADLCFSLNNAKFGDC